MATAVERAKRLAEEIKGRAKDRAEPRQEPVTYPRFSKFVIRDMEVEDECPACGEVIGVDFGRTTMEEIPDSIEFECEECGIGWEVALALNSLLVSWKPWKWEQTTKNHWQAELPKDHLLTVWGHEDTAAEGDWHWEVWPDDRPNPDEPDFAGTEGSFEDACAAAERCAKEQSLL